MTVARIAEFFFFFYLETLPSSINLKPNQFVHSIGNPSQTFNFDLDHSEFQKFLPKDEHGMLYLGHNTEM